MKLSIHGIPILKDDSTDTPHYVAGQPIIQVKELEPDKVRYDAFKTWVAQCQCRGFHRAVRAAVVVSLVKQEQ